MIARAIHLYCWGTVNLEKNQLNLIVGVPSDTLNQTLLVTNVSSDYVLQIPVTGFLSNPNVDTKTTSAQLPEAVVSGQVEKWLDSSEILSAKQCAGFTTNPDASTKISSVGIGLVLREMARKAVCRPDWI